MKFESLCDNRHNFEKIMQKLATRENYKITIVKRSNAPFFYYSSSDKVN